MSASDTMPNNAANAKIESFCCTGRYALPYILHIRFRYAQPSLCTLTDHTSIHHRTGASERLFRSGKVQGAAAPFNNLLVQVPERQSKNTLSQSENLDRMSFASQGLGVSLQAAASIRRQTQTDTQAMILAEL